MRAPLLGERALAALSDGLESPLLSSADPELDEAAVRDRARVRRGLNALLEDPWFEDAIALASPGLARGLAGWRGDPEGPRSARVETSLLRYVSRAATRATPFGLLAGVATGRVGSETAFELGSPSTRRPRLRLEADAVAGVIEAVLADPERVQALELRPAPALYPTANGWRLCDADGSWSLLPGTRPLAATLELASAGLTWGELAKRLGGSGAAGVERASAYVAQLVRQGVLVTTLRPEVTSATDPAHAVLRTLKVLPGPNGLAGDLERTLHELDDAATTAPGAGMRAAAEAAAARLPGNAEPPKRIRAELRLAADSASLDAGALAGVGDALDLLGRLVPPDRDELEPFAGAFLRRFGQQEVPLLEAIDPDLGAGLPPLEPPRLDGAKAARVDEPHAALASLLRDPGASEVELRTPGLEALARPAGPLPATLVALLAPLADGRVALSEASGPGAPMLTRFACDDSELTDALRALAEADAAADPDALVADVLWDPQVRSRNVVERPPILPWEIEASGRSGAPPERRLALSDLTLAVTETGEIVLRSQAHARRVLPRWNTGLRVDDAPLPARFLGLLAQRPPAFRTWAFRWGAGLSALPYLPRVACGPVVLSPRRWTITGHELSLLVGASSDGERVRAARELRERRGLPRHVRTGDSDRVIELDLDNPLALATLAAGLRGSDGAALVESLPGAAGASGPDGPHRVELLVPLVAASRPEPAERLQAAAAVRPPLPADEEVSLAGPRAFAPGSEWLFASLFCGGVARDRLLRGVVAPLARDLRADGVVDDWHFLRYGDPSPHLRVRFHGEPQRLAGEALPALFAALKDGGAADPPWRVTVDTYVRELERYGGSEATRQVERAFTADSEAVCGLLALSPMPNRFMAAVALGLDTVVAMLPEEAQPIAALASLRDNVALRAHSTREDHRRRGREYREHQAALDAFVADPPAGLWTLLSRRHEALREVGEALARLDAGRRLSAEPIGIVTSLVHLTVHRLVVQPTFSDEAWIHEMAVRVGRAREARGQAVTPWASAPSRQITGQTSGSE